VNRRDQQIAEINANVSDLRTDRLQVCRAQIMEAYARASIVDKLAHVRELTDREPSDFRVLTSSETRPEAQFNDNSYHWDFYCEEFGRSVAVAEKRYLFEVLSKASGSGGPLVASQPSFDWLWRGVQQLRAAGFNPTVLAGPISLFLPVHKSLQIDLQTGRRVELPDKSKLDLFWSSRMAPLDRFVVLDRRAGDWRVKLDPDTGERLTVAIGRPKSPASAVTFLAETVVKYDIFDPHGFYVTEVVGEPPDEFGLAPSEPKDEGKE